MSSSNGIELPNEASNSGPSLTEGGELDVFEDCEPESFVIIPEQQAKLDDTNNKPIPYHSHQDFLPSGFELSPEAKDLIKRAVKVVNVKAKDRNVLRNIISLEKNGGGDIESEYYSSREGIVYFIFEDHQVASNLLKKGTQKVMSHIYKFEPPEIVEYLSINSSGLDEKKESRQSRKNKSRGKGQRKSKNGKIMKDPVIKREHHALAGEANDNSDNNGDNDDDNSDVAEHETGSGNNEMPRNGNYLNVSQGDNYTNNVNIKQENSTSHMIQDGSVEMRPDDPMMSLNDGKYHGSFMPSFDSHLSTIPSLENYTNQFEREEDSVSCGGTSSSKSQRSIIIYGVPNEDFIDDALIFRLEHKRRGGGMVDSIGKYDAVRKRVAITFQDSKVVENFVKKMTLNVQCCEMFVLSLDKESELERTIIISNVEDEEEKESLLIFLESAKRGGGKIKKEKYDQESKELCVAFEEKSDKFKNARILKAFGKNFPIKEAPIYLLIDIDLSSRTVFISEVVDEIHQNVVEILESDKYGGPVLHYLILRKDVLQVIFYSELVSQKVSDMRHIVAMGKTFHIAKSLEELNNLIEGSASSHPVIESLVNHSPVNGLQEENVVFSDNSRNDSERRKSSHFIDEKHEAIDVECYCPEMPEFLKNSTHNKEQNCEEILIQSMKIVLLTDLADTTLELLIIYLQNLNLNFDVKYFNNKEKQAAIEFENEKEAQRFCESKNELLSAALHLLEVNPSNFESHAILVMNAKGMEEDLLYYFKNEYKSGGGPLREWGFRDENKFYITFEHLQDVHSVLNREHNLNGNKLQIQQIGMQPPPPHVPEDVVDRKRLFVRNLKPKINRNYFKSVIENVGKVHIEDLVEGKKLAMLVFQNPPDYYALREHTSCYPIKGYMVTLQKVPHTKQIQLALPLNHDVELVKKYLCNLAGGWDEPEVKVNSENGLVIMTFNQHTSVQQILSSDLAIGDLKIVAKPYYKELQVDVVKPIIPTEGKFFHNSADLDFVSRHQNVRQEIETSFQMTHPAHVLWQPSNGEVILKLFPDQKDVAHDWRKSAEDRLKELLKPYRWREKSCLKDLWPEVTNLVKQYVDSSRISQESTEILYDEKEHAIRFNGPQNVCHDLDEFVDRTIKKILSKKEKVNEVVTLNLKHLDLIRKMEASLAKEKQVLLSISEDGAVLDGPSELVSKMKLEIFEKVNNFVSEEFELENFFHNYSILGYIDCKLKERGVHASFFPSSGNVLVLAECETSLAEARNLFGAIKKSGHIKLDSDQRVITKLELWRDFVVDLQSKLLHFEIQEENDGLTYVCVDASEKELIECVNKFLEENRLTEKFVEVQYGILRGISKFFSGDLKEIDNLLRRQGGKIIEAASPKGHPGFLLIGQKSTLDTGLMKMEELKSKIHLEKITLKKPNITGFFESGDFKRFIKNVEETNNKISIIINSKEINSTPCITETFHEFLFLEKFKVIVTSEDVSSIKVDAIVKICSTELGSDSQKSSKQDDIEKAEIKDNKLLVSKSVGSLPCKLIYYVQVSQSELVGNPELLLTQLQHVFEDVNENKYLSISILCLTLKGDDSESYLTVLVPSLTTFIGQCSGPLQKFIIFCEDVNAVNLCRSLLMEYNEGQMKMGIGGDNPKVDSDEEQIEFIDASPGLQEIEIIKGSIVNVEADVIVNSTSKELDLKRGQVSSCLLAAAGVEIQEECSKKRSKSFNDGDIVSTKGYKLKCKKVYHTSCGTWKGGQSGAIICKIINTALTKATKKSFKTIAFPALGTGNLRAPPKEVANLMFQEATSFMMKNRNTSIKKIYFVVYEKDMPTVKAFEDCWKSFSLGLVCSGKTESLNRKDLSGFGSGEINYAASENSTLTIDVSNPYKLTLNGLEVEVVKGDITSFPADAIVNSTNQNMDLSGAVSKAIVKKGGANLVVDLQTAKMKDSGVCVTKAGDLPANFIIHVVAQKNIGDWSAVIFEALKESDVYGCKSIAFPVLGTGNFKQSVEEMARVMIENFNEFGGSSERKNLKKIFICIFLDDILDGFIKGIKKLNNDGQGLVSKILSTFKEKVMGYVSKDPGIPKEQPRSTFVDHSIQTIEVVGIEPSVISEVVGSIRNYIGDQFCEKILDSERDKMLIRKLKNYQISELECLKEKFRVDIKVDNRESSRKIMISGFHENFSGALKHVMEILKKVEDEERELLEAESVAKQVMWEYRDTDNTFKPYDSMINLKLEKAFTSGGNKLFWKDTGKQVFVDFDDMKESRENRSTEVRRLTAGFNLPNNWTSIPGSQKFSVITLAPDHKEFLEVHDNFMATSNNTVKKIHKIERIQNPTLYKIYQARKEGMEKSLPGHQVEKTLWHGTSANVIDQINEHGFNRSYCGKNATAFGRGVYFAKNVSYSARPTYSVPDANGMKRIYQCKVLVGEFTTGSQIYMVPPAKQGSHDSYDSVVDNVMKPELFVIFYDDQAYPEYLIQFS